MKNEHIVTVGKPGMPGKPARILETAGAVTQVEYTDDKRRAVVPTRWIRK